MTTKGANQTMIRKTYGQEPIVFDERTALMYSGEDKALLKNFIKDFLAHKESTKEKIVVAFADEKWDEYTILVHGLKSSSLSVGGKKISAAAKELEQAGKDFAAADSEEAKATAVEFIKKHNDGLFALYDEFAAACEKYLEQ